jgi:hypothetical protein
LQEKFEDGSFFMVEEGWGQGRVHGESLPVASSKPRPTLLPKCFWGDSGPLKHLVHALKFRKGTDVTVIRAKG